MSKTSVFFTAEKCAEVCELASTCKSFAVQPASRQATSGNPLICRTYSTDAAVISAESAPFDLYIRQGGCTPQSTAATTRPASIAQPDEVRKPTKSDIGRRATVTGFDSEGTIMFIGKRIDINKKRIGICLDAAEGNTRGTVKGTTYFTCKKKHGILVPANKVRVAVQGRLVQLHDLEAADAHSTSVHASGYAVVFVCAVAAVLAVKYHWALDHGKHSRVTPVSSQQLAEEKQGLLASS